MDTRIELVSIPVTDIDRAIAFYTEQVGFTLDHDHRVREEIRFVQITPPGSARSILVGNLSEMEPGTQRGLQCVSSDADAALAQLRAAGGRRGRCGRCGRAAVGTLRLFQRPRRQHLGVPADRAAGLSPGRSAWDPGIGVVPGRDEHAAQTTPSC
jgi:predicted enzyme related to lactoylglutathione lyase